MTWVPVTTSSRALQHPEEDDEEQLQHQTGTRELGSAPSQQLLLAASPQISHRSSSRSHSCHSQSCASWKK